VSQVPFQSSYDQLTAAWRAIRVTHGLRLREVACVGAPRTILVAELGDPHAPLVAISAGAHGDEPAGPWALHALVRDQLLDPHFRYRLWPCLNPSGLAAGTRANAEGSDVNRSFGRGGTTPESRAVLTSNRDLRFALTLDLHEDFEADGFYLYEPLLAGAASLYADSVAGAVAEAGFPLQRRWDGFETGPPGSEAAQTRLPGAVVVDAVRETPAFAGALPLGLVLVRRAARSALTLESPRQRPWDDRIAIHRVGVVAALARLALEERRGRAPSSSKKPPR
jgi:protein MpaA